MSLTPSWWAFTGALRLPVASVVGVSPDAGDALAVWVNADYQHQWGALPDDATWRRWLDRSLRMELAPLPDGTLRRRSVRDALVNEWAWLGQADALAALAEVTVPVLIVHADGPFYGAPYLDDASLQAQLNTAPDSRLFVEHGRNHGDIVYRPSEEFLQTLRRFVTHARARSHVFESASP